jgi:hypothetical protein
MPSPLPNTWFRPTRQPRRRVVPWRRWALLAALAVGVGLTVYLRPFAAAGPATAEGLPVGPKLGHLELQPLTGFAKSLGPGDLRGKIVVLHVWGPDFGGCFDGLSQLAEIDRRFRTHPKLCIVCVACSARRDEDLSVLSYETAVLMRQANLEMASHTDARGATCRAIAAATGIEQLPVTLLLDAEGRIRAVWTPQPEGNIRLADLVAKLLAEP